VGKEVNLENVKMRVLRLGTAFSAQRLSWNAVTASPVIDAHLIKKSMKGENKNLKYQKKLM